MDRDDLALDGLLRELARAPEGDDAFVRRVLARTGPRSRRPSRRAPIALAAAGLFVALGFLLDAPPAARMGFHAQACLVPDAKSMRVIAADGDRRVLLGEVPIDAQVLVPAATPILLQAVGADGMALWTDRDPLVLRPGEIRAAATAPRATLEKRSVDYRRDVKPLLDQHCSGCHAESELLATAKPFHARRSGLVTQTHGLLASTERRQIALWVDLGAERP